VLALLIYNRVRFDAWLEFGLGHQLTTIHFLKGARYLAANLYSYALRPLEKSCHFPYLKALWDMGPPAFPRWLRPPASYWVHEPVAGAGVSIPWVWLCAWVAPSLMLAARAARRAGAALDARARGLVFCVAAFGAAAFASMLPALVLFSATMRYLADGAPGMALLGTLGAWMLVSDLGVRAWLRWALTAGCLALSAYTIAFGLLLGFQGYHQAILWQNPALYQKLITRYTLCKDGRP